MPLKKLPGSMPRISVVVAAYNYARYLPRAIESMLSQRVVGMEVIVVDDGSTDETPQILKGYSDRVRTIRQENQGYVKAKNRGIREAYGKYVIFLDADDEFLPGILEKLGAELERDAEAAFAYCDYYELDERTGKKKTIRLNKNIFHSVAIGILFRRSVLEGVGAYTEGMVFPEYDLLLKLQARGILGAYVPEPLFVYHRHAGSVTADRKKVKEGVYQLEEKYGKRIKIRGY